MMIDCFAFFEASYLPLSKRGEGDKGEVVNEQYQN